MNILKFSGYQTMALHPKKDAVTVMFHDNSRVVIDLTSGNPLFIRALTGSTKLRDALATRFVKELSQAELYEQMICLKYKDKRTAEISISVCDYSEGLPDSIISRIRSSAASYPGKKCEIYIGHLFPNENLLSIEKSIYRLPSSQADESAEDWFEFEVVSNFFIVTFWIPESSLFVPSKVLIAQVLVQDILDVLSFVSRHYYTAYVSKVVNIENEVIFEHEELNISNNQSARWLESYNFVSQTFSSEKSWYLRFAVNDFKMAIFHPLNTGFYCRRALESLSHHLANLKDIVKTPDRWGALVAIISMDDTIFLEIKNYGGDERHGNSKGISTEKRRQFIDETRRAMIRYFEWVSRYLAGIE